MDREGPTTALPDHTYDAALANDIERKWRERWDRDRAFLTPNPTGELAEPNRALADRPKFYVLDMFPYPSGDGLHVGHPLGYIATDIYARFKRMSGFNVLHTMGYDAFGLPAERYAVDTGRHPDETTRANIANMARQLHRLGLAYDSRRGVSTTDVEFYKWTQWIFLQLYNAWYDEETDRARPVDQLIEALETGDRSLPDGRDWHALDQRERRRALDGLRLAYLDDVTVNWCPALGTVLANEEVTADGHSEEGNFPVYRRPLRQWMLRITAYARRLIEDLAELEWPESLKTMQRNWVGRSEGALITFSVDRATNVEIEVFTTRPDTLFGVSFLAVAPEHPLLDLDLPKTWDPGTPQEWRGEDSAAGPAEACAAYREKGANRSDRDRQAEQEMTGIYTGIDATHPLSGERVPVLVADYVLASYGSKAVMGVPAHDTRDFLFAKQLSLPIEEVVKPPVEWYSANGLADDAEVAAWPEAFTGDGTAVGSGDAVDGLPSAEARQAVIDLLAEAGVGGPTISYKLRDWLFSRQRYWGEPFPIVYDEEGDPHALPESMLPVVLPDLEDFAPRIEEDDPEAEPAPPLTRAKDWLEVELDLGEGPRTYRRETNTMPQWAGSCWYYIRYADPTNAESFVDPANERYWMGGDGNVGAIDLYVGGVEHAVLHLLYARFWHKVLYDLGHVSTSEPFQRLFNQGMVQAPAYTDSRGFYVPAEQVKERDDKYYYEGEEVTRHYGKMGKSLKNGVAPDDVIESYGADGLRLYEMFLGPLDQSRPWETQGIVGIMRFLRRVWRMIVDEDSGEILLVDDPPAEGLRRSLHRAIASVRHDIDRLHFNTAISTLMELSNEATAGGQPVSREIAEWMILALAPFAPHMCEELWERIGHEGSLAYVEYPVPDPRLCEVDEIQIAVQVDGKLRGVVALPADADQAAHEDAARSVPTVASYLEGSDPVRVVVVPGRLVNFVLP